VSAERVALVAASELSRVLTDIMIVVPDVTLESCVHIHFSGGTAL